MLRYLCGAVGYDLRYVSGGEAKLHGFTYSHWQDSAVDKWDTSSVASASN